VHPRDHPWRRVVRRVGDVHAARRPEDDRPGPGRLDHELHDQRGLAPLASTVPRGKVLFEGNLLNSPERLESLRDVREDFGHVFSPYSRTPSHCVLRGDLPVEAASKQRSAAL
jgi:hypothetical protein